MADLVLGVLLDDGREFVLDGSGVSGTPSVSQEFPLGTRVRVTNPDKCFAKFDEMAKTLNLGKFSVGRKPASSVVGTVVGSEAHPTDSSMVIVAVRAEDGAELLFDSRGLQAASSVSSEWSVGSRVRIVEDEKVYSRMDDVAVALTLSKWVSGAKPQKGETGVVLGSASHPVTAGAIVVGVRTDTHKDYVMAPEALRPTPSVSTRFPSGCRVRIVKAEKLYTKMDDMAEKLNLCGWAAGSKPAMVPAKEQPTEEALEAAAPAEDGDKDPAAKKPKVEPKMELSMATSIGEAVGSEKHPDGQTIVVGVKTDGGPSYLVSEEGLEAIPSASAEFPIGSRVRVEPGKIYPKHDAKAAELCLPRWAMGAKPANVLTGKVMSSAAK